MKKYYLTFGGNHTHRVNGITWDCDVVCVIEAEDMKTARDTAFELFSDKWFTVYEECPSLEYFKRGTINLNQ